MVPTLVTILMILLMIASIWVEPVFTQWHRQRLKNRCFPLAWANLLNQNLPIYQILPEALRRQLQGQIQVFLAEKQFIGCQGFEITLKVKLIIAAQACLLLLNERGTYYPLLNSILVYPSAFKLWFGEIVGYFESRTTSGVVEGINNKLKLIKRSGFGFRNFHNFETRALLAWHYPINLAL